MLMLKHTSDIPITFSRDYAHRTKEGDSSNAFVLDNKYCCCTVALGQLPKLFATLVTVAQ